MNKKNIGIIGFGYIGSVIGAVLAARGNRVYGFDTNPRIVESISSMKSPFCEPGLQELISAEVSRGNLSASTNPECLKACDYFILTVGTPLSNNYTADITHLSQACAAIGPYVKTGDLLVVKSTVPPGTTRSVVAEFFSDKNVDIAFCPERLAEGRAIDELTTIPIVIGGLTEEAGLAAQAFFEETLGVETMTVESPEAAEMTKLADNLWIDTNIALAGELAKICHSLEIDVLDVIQAANSLPKGQYHVNILTPSVGVGGYCLTKDPWFVDELGKRLGTPIELPAVSRKVNDSMPVYCANIVDELLVKHHGLQRDSNKVAILGISFKNDTGDCRHSPTKYYISTIQNLGYPIDIADPLVTADDALLITDLKLNTSIEEAIKGASCVSFLTGHKEFLEIEVEWLAKRVKPGAIVFDGRRYFTKQEIQKLREAGLIYQGVGR